MKDLINFIKKFFSLLFKGNFKALFIEPTDDGFMQFFRYIFVGGASFLADYVLLHLITEAGVHYLISGTISFMAGLWVNYALSKLLVFQKKTDGAEKAKEMIVFAVVAVTGLAMSLLAAGCGFAAGVANPFTIGVAQGLAGLPTFSGMWLRFVSFLLIYGLLLLFIRFHAKKTEKPLQIAKEESGFEKNPRMDKALLYFACILGTGILLVLCSSFLPFLQAYTMIIVALMFLIGGLVAVSKSGMEKKKRWETFVSGVVSILPSILMILMASSIKYMMVEGKILDTMLHGAVQVASGLPKGGLILFIYLICLVMNFFIPSGSAKAFLLIPLIVPLAQIFGLSTQLCIVAFAFGDGFSNVFYPTNPALLISLSLGRVNYGEWAKYSAKFQGLNLILTSGILLLGLVLGY